jgi:hypothetical protein
MTARANGRAPRKNDEPWFGQFDPFHSLIGASVPAFRDAQGCDIALPARSEKDAQALLWVAHDAVKVMLVGIALNQNQWRRALEKSADNIAMMRDLLPPDGSALGTWQDQLGRPVPAPRIADLDDFTLLWVWHQRAIANPSAFDDFIEGKFMMETLWCLLGLREVDAALMALLARRRGNDIATHAIRAAHAVANAKALRDGVPTSAPTMTINLSRNGAKGAAVTNQTLPSRAAKGKAKVYWDRWQAEPQLYASASAWARDMAEKFPEVTDVRTFQRWHTEFKKQHS